MEQWPLKGPMNFCTSADRSLSSSSVSSFLICMSWVVLVSSLAFCHMFLSMTFAQQKLRVEAPPWPAFWDTKKECEVQYFLVFTQTNMETLVKHSPVKQALLRIHHPQRDLLGASTFQVLLVSDASGCTSKSSGQTCHCSAAKGLTRWPKAAESWHLVNLIEQRVDPESWHVGMEFFKQTNYQQPIMVQCTLPAVDTTSWLCLLGMISAHALWHSESVKCPTPRFRPFHCWLSLHLRRKSTLKSPAPLPIWSWQQL